MKKTLIASAVAAAALSSNAFAMDQATDLAEMLESMPTFYGNVQLVHKSSTLDNGTGAAYVNADDGWNVGAGDEQSQNEFQDGGSTFGFTHSHKVSDDVEAFLKAEFEFGADDKGSSSGIAALDEAYVGVKGGFGSVQVGSDDTVYDWIDMIDTSEQIGLGGGISADDQGDNIQYVSPEIGGGLTLGITYPLDSDTNFGGSIAGAYSMDNISVALSYSMGREEDGVDVEDTIGLGASISLEDLTLALQYETRDEFADYIGLQGMYTMGANTFALGYAMTSPDASGLEDQTEIYLQALHSVSDNMYVYLEYAMTSDYEGSEDLDLNELAIGTAYAF